MRPVRATLALFFVAAAGQSCVLESLEANRVEAGGAGGSSAGSQAKAGSGGALPGVAGTVSAGGKSQGGGSGAGTAGATSAGSGVGGGSGSGNPGGAGEGGSGDEPPGDWVRCDPTFAYDSYAECPTIQPEIGSACDDDVFYPEDLCAYCQDPKACPVETEYVALLCVNRSWRVRDVFGVGCCPDAHPIHGTACDNNAFCEYGVGNICECIAGTWQCCDAFDGDACTAPGDQCIVSFGPVEADKCICDGASAATATWSCCPYFPPFNGDVCYYDNVSCAYQNQTCTCATYGANWSCN